MKTKLLRKVRKEFKIEYWPNGVSPESGYNTPRVKLIFKGSTVDTFPVNNSVEGRPSIVRPGRAKSVDEAIGMAKDKIIEELRSRYPHLGSYRKKFTKQQIWP